MEIAIEGSTLALDPVAADHPLAAGAIDARGQVVMPGLVNAHAHVARGGVFESVCLGAEMRLDGDGRYTRHVAPYVRRSWRRFADAYAAFGNDASYGFSLVARPADELAAMQRAGLDAAVRRDVGALDPPREVFAGGVRLRGAPGARGGTAWAFAAGLARTVARGLLGA